MSELTLSTPLPPTPKFWQALLAVQKDIKDPKKSSVNPHFKSNFADYESVVDSVKPAYNEKGLLIDMSAIGYWQDSWYHVGIRVKRVLVETGEGDVHEFALPVSLPITPQQWGALNTYLKRQLLILLAFLAPTGEDDDGEALRKEAAANEQAVKDFQNAKLSALKNGYTESVMKEWIKAHGGSITPATLKAFRAEFVDKKKETANAN